MSSDDAARRVTLTRTGRLTFRATNALGATIDLGPGGDAAEFSPVDLLLAAIAGCTAMDVDAITAKRAEAEEFDLVSSGQKVRDGDGNHLVDLTVDFSVRFPEGEAGDAARGVLQTAIRRSHDRLCTVSRTVELTSPIAVTLEGAELEEG
ncbi:MAG TPA: OsmC family protein [Microlunatus sp.]|nr:OsmC family protein [Microlunatus sp.]